MFEKLVLTKSQSDPDTKYLYRYDAENYIDGVQIRCLKYSIVGGTPAGFWIQNFRIPEDEKPNRKNATWVSKSAKKRFAYPTKAEALDGFIHRKNRQISILKARMESAEKALYLAMTEKRALTLENDDGL